MAYIVPAFNSVSVDLYKAGGLTIPAFNSVNVDLFISDEISGPLLIFVDSLDDEIHGDHLLKKALEIVRIVGIDDYEDGEVVLLNRPAVIITLDDEDVPEFLIESYVKEIQISGLDDEEALSDTLVTHYIRDVFFPSIDDEDMGNTLVSHLHRSFSFPSIEDEEVSIDTILTSQYSNINIINFMMLLG